MNEPLVFSGDWHTHDMNPNDHRTHAIGYAGQSVGTDSEGLPVPAFPLPVLRFIIDEHNAERASYRRQRAGQLLLQGEALEKAVNFGMERLELDDDLLVITLRGDTLPEGAERRHVIEPDADGFYSLAVLEWSWEPVQARYCVEVIDGQ